MIHQLSDMRLDRGVGGDGASALFSHDDRHRYMLERKIAGVTGGRRLVACGLNPSTADAFKLDPTCRREVAFAAAWECSLYVKVNAYSWRATKPKDMWLAQDAEYMRTGSSYESDKLITGGKTNDHAIMCALTMLKRDGGIALACWGAQADQKRVLKLVRIAHEVGVQWWCLGTNREGSPRHPLYVKATTKLEPWISSGQLERVREQTRHDVAASVARHADLK